MRSRLISTTAFILTTNSTNNTNRGQVLAKEGEVYAVYLPVAENTGVLDLSGTRGIFRLRWFNPRTGLFSGVEIDIQAGSSIAHGKPPLEPMEDWVALFTRKDSTP